MGGQKERKDGGKGEEQRVVIAFEVESK